MTITSASELNTVEEVVAFVRQFDHNNYLTDIDDPQELIAFYYGAYEVGEGELSDKVQIQEYIDMIDRVFPNFSVHEGYGGIEADSGRELVISAIEVHWTEFPDDFHDLMDMHKELGLI